MRYLKRGPAPIFWTREQVKKWTQQWLDKNFKSYRWAWPQHQGRRLNLRATEHLESWHYKKCAFCETPLWGEREIEHFRSKTQYPLCAFVWRNLFLICGSCNQKKGAKTHIGCLKPDREDPVDYLWVNPILLKVEPKPGISDKAHQRAVTTIACYQLDRPELKKLYEEYLCFIPEGQSLSVERLRILSQPDRFFSLFMKSRLEYLEAKAG